MDVNGGSCNSDIQSERETSELRRGPWTVEEDFVLINYIANHGEGRWNSLARCAGLKRTGKSCRLRWLNYLRPDVRRGNITLQEQLVIIELHSRWGNRWSKIAQHLPGRTDNEIKNYWRTRVQKHAKQLKCDVNSKQFKDNMRYLWMPRLVERIQASSSSSTTSSSSAAANTCHLNGSSAQMGPPVLPPHVNPSFTPEISSTPSSSDSFGMAQVSPLSHLPDYYNYAVNDQDYSHVNQVGFVEPLTSPSAYFDQNLDLQVGDHEYHHHQWMAGAGDLTDNLWNVDDIWFLQHQLTTNL